MSGAGDTEGRRLLAEVTATDDEIAEAVGVSRRLVSYWRKGSKRPGGTNRAKLREVYGIPQRAWGSKAGADLGAAEEEAKARRAISSRSLSSLDHAEELLEEARRARLDPDLIASERGRLVTEEGRLLALKARLERERELVEDRIVREHPMWLRIRAVFEWLGQQLEARDPELADELEARLTKASGEGG